MAKLVAIIVRELKRIFSPASVWHGLVGHPKPQPASPQPRADEGYERRDIRAIPVMLGGIGLLVTVALIAGVTWGLFTFLIRHPGQDAAVSPLATQRQQSNAPRLEVVPGTTFEDTLRRTNAILDSYGWVDRQHGIVHIPIDHAIDLLAQRGLPVRSTSAISSTGSTGGQPTK